MVQSIFKKDEKIVVVKWLRLFGSGGIFLITFICVHQEDRKLDIYVIYKTASK